MVRAVAACGTDAGYYRHRRVTMTEPCDACRAAHSLEVRRVDKGLPPKPPTKLCTGCGGRIVAVQYDQCAKCRARASAKKTRVRVTPAEITWEKDSRGIFRAVYVGDPEPDGPRRGAA